MEFLPFLSSKTLVSGAISTECERCLKVLGLQTQIQVRKQNRLSCANCIMGVLD
jgi:hypothetical protein